MQHSKRDFLAASLMVDKALFSADGAGKEDPCWLVHHCTVDWAAVGLWAGPRIQLQTRQAGP